MLTRDRSKSSTFVASDCTIRAAASPNATNATSHTRGDATDFTDATGTTRDATANSIGRMTDLRERGHKRNVRHRIKTLFTDADATHARNRHATNTTVRNRHEDERTTRLNAHTSRVLANLSSSQPTQTHGRRLRWNATHLDTHGTQHREPDNRTSGLDKRATGTLGLDAFGDAHSGEINRRVGDCYWSAPFPIRVSFTSVPRVFRRPGSFAVAFWQRKGRNKKRTGNFD